MLIYALNFISIPIYDLIFKNKKILINILCIQMWLILILRSSFLGPDTENYYTYYELWSSIPVMDMIYGTRFFLGQDALFSLESGYVWLNWILSNIGLSFHSFLIIHSSICVWGLRRFLIKNSYNPGIFLAFILAFGIFSYYIFILRQALALTFLLQSIQSIKEKKTTQFFLWIILATLFHRISIIFSIIYFVNKIKITWNKIIIMLLITLGIFFVFPTIFSGIKVILVALGKDTYDIENEGGTTLFLFYFIMSTAVLMLAGGLKTLNGNDYSVFAWCMFVGLISQVSAIYAPVLARSSQGIFSPFLFLLLGNLIYKQNYRDKIIYTSIFYFIALLIFIYFIGDAPYVPYEAVWDD